MYEKCNTPEEMFAFFEVLLRNLIAGTAMECGMRGIPPSTGFPKILKVLKKVVNDCDEHAHTTLETYERLKTSGRKSK